MDAADLLKTKPSSLLHSITEHFLNDSRDFATRFDVLWEDGRLMHKMGRTKSFMDLLMRQKCASSTTRSSRRADGKGACLIKQRGQ